MAQCDFNCPPLGSLGIARCCRWCSTSQKKYVTANNEALWTERKGFLGDDGCKLSRDAMPDECKAYNCHDSFFGVYYVRCTMLEWDGEKWKQSPYFQGLGISEVTEKDGMIKAIAEHIANSSLPDVQEP